MSACVYLQRVGVEDFDSTVQQRDSQQSVVGRKLYTQNVLLQLQCTSVFHRQPPAYTNTQKHHSFKMLHWRCNLTVIRSVLNATYFCPLPSSLTSSNSQNLTVLSALPVTIPLYKIKRKEHESRILTDQSYRAGVVVTVTDFTPGPGPNTETIEHHCERPQSPGDFLRPVRKSAVYQSVRKKTHQLLVVNLKWVVVQNSWYPDG